MWINIAHNFGGYQGRCCSLSNCFFLLICVDSVLGWDGTGLSRWILGCEESVFRDFNVLKYTG